MAGWIWKSAPVAALVGVAVLAFAASVPAATNLIANGTFEGSGSGSLSGWAASSGTLALVAGNGGGHAARVTASTAGTKTYAYTSSKPVKTATAGAAYTLDGTVRIEHRRLGVPDAQGGAVRRLEHRRLGAAVRHGDDGVAGVPDGGLHRAQERRLADGRRDRVRAGRGGELRHGQPGARDRHGVGRRPAPERPRRRERDRRRADVRDRHLVAVDRQRRRDRIRRLPRSDEGAARSAARPRASPTRRSAPSTTYGYTVDAFDAATNHSAQSSPPASVTTPSGGGGGGGGSGPCGTVAPSTAPYSHIVVIMDENLTVAAWQAATDAPVHPHAGDELPVRGRTRPARRIPSFPNYQAVTQRHVQHLPRLHRRAPTTSSTSSTRPA